MGSHLWVSLEAKGRKVPAIRTHMLLCVSVVDSER